VQRIGHKITPRKPDVKLKPVEEVTACVVDYGTFESLAERLGQTMAKVYYCSPTDREYVDVRDAVIGHGIEGVERIDDFFEKLDEIDLFVFPDIRFGGLQKHLDDIGKAVWGSLGADELELSRTLFLDTLEEIGLPVVKSERIVGLAALAYHLKGVNDKWIKIDSFRGNMETWHHIDFAHSQRRLESLAVTFGGAAPYITFVVQDTIEADYEVGYDGWCIDGRFPSKSLQGYEKKDELYLGSLQHAVALPGEVRYVNEAMAPVLERYGYRNWWATEIRVADGTPYFIDPTPRLSGLASESQQENCLNLPNVIWHGANGILIPPEFGWDFTAEATLHYDGGSTDDAVDKEWKVLALPSKAKRFVKLYHYCIADGLYHFVPDSKDEIGVVVGVGDSVDASIKHLKKTLSVLEEASLPVHADTKDFVDLIEEIEEAEKKGIAFGGKLPKKESVL
jgi:hypothetical protein